jgi:hypothetical protein
MDNGPGINIKAFFVGLFALLGFSVAFYFTCRDKFIREKGIVIKAPIVELSTPYSNASSVYVFIKGKKIFAGQYKGREYSIGDSIEVFYIPGEYCVVQKGVSPNRFILYFALEFFLILIPGLYLVVQGLRGKGTDSIRSRDE